MDGGPLGFNLNPDFQFSSYFWMDSSIAWPFLHVAFGKVLFPNAFFFVSATKPGLTSKLCQRASNSWMRQIMWLRIDTAKSSGSIVFAMVDVVCVFHEISFLRVDCWKFICNLMGSLCNTCAAMNWSAGVWGEQKGKRFDPDFPSTG